MIEPQSAAYAAFETELHEVERTLAATADELGGPLGELVRGQVMRARPSVRAALVLAVAMTEQPASAGTEPSSSRRQARMNLAAALEMLYIALNIHRLLVDAVAGSAPTNTLPPAADPQATPSQADDDEQLDRAFVGSTILAGDYCFSRAAQLAAHTDHPTVVALFAQALQTISESRLRHQFGDAPAVESTAPRKAPQTTPQDDTVELLESGAQAAAVLAGLDAAQRSQALQLAHELAAQLVPGAVPAARPSPSQTLDLGLQTRRQILLRWLAAQAANGRGPLSSSDDTQSRGRYN